ncbi:MAG TPA: LiaF domain-containing protein [Streptosporangiaceae bacterium]|nr:LiaF domain-containing protein [Streptosporangiaceae bacterium]
MQAVTVFGGVDLDFREAVLPQAEINLRAICVLGGVSIIVPPEMQVIDDGWALMGGIEVPPATPESQMPGTPVLRFTGVTILGGVSVRRKPR